MRSIARALGSALRAQRHVADLQQRTQASLAARDVAQPELPPFDHEPVQYIGPSKQEVMELRKRYLNPAILAWYKDPVMVTEGKMQYLYDETGRRYLDVFAGIVTVSVGHCHPKVVAAVDRQNHLLQHTTNIYLNNEIAEYAQELTSTLPGNLNVAYFVNSGSEANDMAILLARLYSGNHDLIALRNCYHGISEGLLGVLGHSTWKYNVPSSGGVKHALNPDPYRGRFGNDGPAYAEDVRDLIQTATSGQVAGFLSETIQGVGGATPLADGYLAEAYKHVRAAGGVCIADEVQTGFGRTGTKFWGFENQGVVPDIVTMAKGIGNGLPLAAVVTTEEIAKKMSQRLHFNTFGGNPVCSAGGRAVLKAIEEDGLQANSLKVGGHIKKGIMALKDKHSIIGDVRGQGLMLGVELVKDRQTKAPAKEETLQAFERMKDMGLLIGKGGLLGNVFRIKPPMCITQQDADFMLEVMNMALSEL